MPAITQIGGLIDSREGVHGGRACIAGTSVTVGRIAQWHNQGLSPEEIARKFGHLSLGQVHAALAHYHLNKPGIDAELEAEDQRAAALENEHLSRRS